MKTPIGLSRRELVIELENAIASGNEERAADAAVRMAQMRLNLSIIAFSSEIYNDFLPPDSDWSEPHENISKQTEISDSQAQANNNQSVLENKIELHSTLNSKTHKVKVWIEGQDTTHGPIDMKIREDAVLEDLCKEVEQCFAIETKIQRWIVGNTLCSDLQVPLSELAGEKLDASFYLCLVENQPETDTKPFEEDKKDNVLYKELVDLDQNAVINNIEPFECSICMDEYPQGEGIVLRECAHTFCCQCLQAVVKNCNDFVVSCPDTYCAATLLDREVHGVVTDEEYNQWLNRGLTAAESTIPEAFHCRTKDCPSWAFCDPGVLDFVCPVCGHTNCVPCECIHEGQTCAQYKSNIESTNYELHETKTKEYLERIVANREALKCPNCPAVISKSGGCDGMQCPACKTHLCWATKGPRWGPGGRGDDTGGCRCGYNGLKCDPSCTNCH